ncbi:MAG TPA: VanZ family protein [Flavobacteriaceae bacterium]|nr:VanZ family protein [Flavobacteriaceae bacterium]
MGKVLLYVAIAYSLALFILSLMNIDSLPKLEISNVDKIFHATAYCGLVIVWYVHYFMTSKNQFKWPPLLIICLCAVVFGIIIEILQGKATTYRTEDVFDMLANFSGTVIAVFLILILKNVLEKWKMKFKGSL